MPPNSEERARLDAFREASMSFDAAYGLLAKSCGLSGPEYWSLVLIQEGIVTQRQISEQLCLSRQTLNSAFKLLIQKGLICLEPFEHNQRSKRALLTPEGSRFLLTVIARTRQLEEQAWQALTAQEQQTLTLLTNRFSAALSALLQPNTTKNPCSSEDL